MKDAIAAVEQAYLALEKGDAMVFPVTGGKGSDLSTKFAVKSGLVRSRGLLGMKIGTYWPGNRSKGLPAHGSTTLLLDDATGFPKALVEATYLTALRTAAADAVAVKYLSRADAQVLAVVGAGHQAWFEIEAVRNVRDIRRIMIANRTMGQAEEFAERLRNSGMEAQICDARTAVANADIVVTVTAAESPIVLDEWVRPGTHVSAMGADAVGKQELDTRLLARARLFADVVEQAITIGEFERGIAEGVVDRAAIRTIGSVIAGTTQARVSEDEITIFDSSGIALQDLAIADVACAKVAGEAQ